MHFSRRLTISLICGVTAVCIAPAIYQLVMDLRAMNDDMQRQAVMLAESRQAEVERILQAGSVQELQPLAEQYRDGGRLAGMAIYGADGQLLALTSGLPSNFKKAAPSAVNGALADGKSRTAYLPSRGAAMHIFVSPLLRAGIPIGAIAIFHDASLMAAPIWRHAATSVAQALLVVGITLGIVHWSLGKPLRHMAQWMHDLRTGGGSGAPPKEGLFRSLTGELTQLAVSLHAARAAAEEEARLRAAALSVWTAERLRVSMQAKLQGSRLFAVSNREPYEHVHQGGAIVCRVPPSGLVTALEPVLRASDGTWIAQGTGDADRETSDESGRLPVPPDHPQYRLRRVFLGKEEERGFYLGFSNEGLWPLCHIAHTRPIFRSSDWEHYRTVNQKFAAVLLEEMRDEKAPVVLVQDYHFALLPRLVKERRPDARVAIFWHIPWPNPEAFGICPWQRELLDGMLGADLIGFHIQAHCNNFLETVDRALESRIDWEHFAVNRRESVTTVRPYPISVAVNGETTPGEDAQAALQGVLRDLGGRPEFIGLGVDRVDYTKGIPERLRAVERLFDLYPSYRERFTFIQIGAPSRTEVKRYQELMNEVQGEAERINRKLRSGAWRPIAFVPKHHSHPQISAFYRDADVCMVTSLHDGMNLVAKEYIASRHDEQGALILSRFTGASHELRDALIVNPYDTDELAHAIHTALSMSPEEKRTRMQNMRAVIRDYNVYRWAGSLIGELADIRVEASAPGTHGKPGSRGRRGNITPLVHVARAV